MLSSTPLGSLVLKKSPSADMAEPAVLAAFCTVSVTGALARLKNQRTPSRSMASRITGQSQRFAAPAAFAVWFATYAGAAVSEESRPAGRKRCRPEASVLSEFARPLALRPFSRTWLPRAPRTSGAAMVRRLIALLLGRPEVWPIASATADSRDP